MLENLHTATFGARMPDDKRLALKAQYPDAEHPVVRTHPATRQGRNHPRAHRATYPRASSRHRLGVRPVSRLNTTLRYSTCSNPVRSATR